MFVRQSSSALIWAGKWSPLSSIATEVYKRVSENLSREGGGQRTHRVQSTQQECHAKKLHVRTDREGLPK